MKNYAVVGDWNVLCQVCREKIKASEAVTRWDGLIVGRSHPCFELRHPLDLPQPLPPEEKPLPFTSPEPTDVFIYKCDQFGRSSVASLAQADCAVCDDPLTGVSPDDFDSDGLPASTFPTTGTL